MKRQRNRKTSGFLAALMGIIMIVSATFPSIDAFAAVKDYGDGIKFDAEYYTSAYSDVHAAYGDDETALLGHYMQYGIEEGRTAYEEQSASEIERLKQEKLAKNAQTTATATGNAGSESPTAAVVTDTSAQEGENQTVQSEAEAVVAEEETYGFPEEPQHSKGLVMVYFNGSDLESEGGLGTKALNQMINASKNGTTRFVLLAGGTKKWTHPVLQNANNGGTVSYVVENGQIRKLKEYDSKTEFLSSTMVTEFLKDTDANYKADHKTLVFWDHGGGASGGYGSNELTQKAVTAKALSNGIQDSGVKFEAIGFDTCLMGSLEVASNFTDQARYYVGSQELESGYGWNFEDFENYGTQDFVDFGKKLIDGYDKYNKTNGDDSAHIRTLAMYDLKKIETAQQQWNTLLTELGKTEEGVKALAHARGYAREFEFGSTADYRTGSVDLIDILNDINTPESKAMLATVKEAVLYKNNNTMDGVNGICAYLPGENIYNYDNKYDDIKGNNISDSAMKTLDKLASIYCGQTDAILFSQTKADQKHDDPNKYTERPWYDSNYAQIGNDSKYSYKEVKNGGFAVEAETGLKSSGIQTSEIRVMLKNDENGYVSLGRTSTFCKTADKESPVFNFNGQWLHINGNPVPLYQFDDATNTRGEQYMDMYTLAKINGVESKIHIYWNATQKYWGCPGYVKASEVLNGKNEDRGFKDGDTIEILYDTTKDGKSIEQKAVYPAFTYSDETWSFETKKIDQSKDEVIFHGTITDSFGKTVSTPYFRVGSGTKAAVEETVPGSTVDIKKSEDSQAVEWVYDDDMESFLSCYYNSETGNYDSYNEDTQAYNQILVESGDVMHYNERLGVGIYFNRSEDKYYFLDEDGVITDAEGMNAKELALCFAGSEDDPNYLKYLSILDYIADIDNNGDYDRDSAILDDLYEDLEEMLERLPEEDSGSGTGSNTAAASVAASEGTSAGTGQTSSGTDQNGSTGYVVPDADSEIQYDHESGTYYYYDKEDDTYYDLDDEDMEAFFGDDDDDEE